MKDFKKTYMSIRILGILIVFNSCNYCSDCDVFVRPIYENLPYRNNQIVDYIWNDSIVSNTVNIEYVEPLEQYHCSGEEIPDECAGLLSINLTVLTIGYSQGGYPFFGNHGPSYQTSIGYGYFNCDTVNYNHNGNAIKAVYRQIDSSAIIEINGQMFYDSINAYGQYIYSFYVAFNNRLLQYNIKKQDNIEEWFEHK